MRQLVNSPKRIMNLRSRLSLALIILVIGCAKKEELPALPAGSATTTPGTNAQPTTPPASKADEEEDAMGMTSGVAGAATGQGAAVATSTAEAAATSSTNALQVSSERLAHNYLKSTYVGRSHPNDIVLKNVKKGDCENCWFFTYRVGGITNATVKTENNVPSIFGKIEEPK